MNRLFTPEPPTPPTWKGKIKPYLPRCVKEHFRPYDFHRLRGRIREAWSLRRVRSPQDRTFVVVSSQYNAAEAALKCLDSVYHQKYNPHRIRHLFFDDASNNGTTRMIEDWLRHHPGHRVEFFPNQQRMDMAYNNFRGFRLAAPGEIVAELNGDDWLPDPGVLAFLNRVYADPEVWLTYNTMRFHAKGRYRETAEVYPASPETVSRNAFRECTRFTFSHLRTFRSELFHHIRDTDLRDPQTGEYWRASRDLAYFLPLLEMAGTHTRHLHRLTCIYNLNELSLINVAPEAQREAGKRIRALPKYQPLDRLEPPAKDPS